jgi:phosphate transport system substrate-binding protein
MNKHLKTFLMPAVCALTLSFAPHALANRDQIMAVGSSTVFPFSKVVSERFARKTNMKAPKIEPTGTGGGFKEFCKGVGVAFPDIANASRRIKDSEFAECQANGVKEIIEVHVGFDGIVLANAVKATHYNFELKDIFLALAKKVPDPKGTETLIDNPYKTWKDVNPSLPAHKIEVIGPPPTSGTRDAFVELAMEGGCKLYPWIAAKEKTDKDTYKAMCHGIREDGAYVEAGENDNLIVRKLNENPNAVGIFGFSFLDQNADKVQASHVGGQEPTFENIADGRYVISRPLYFYVKKAHIGVIPGIEAFLAEFTSEAAFGDEGYLAEKGLIPLAADKRKAVAASVKKLDVLTSLQ